MHALRPCSRRCLRRAVMRWRAVGVVAGERESCAIRSAARAQQQRARAVVAERRAKHLGGDGKSERRPAPRRRVGGRAVAHRGARLLLRRRHGAQGPREHEGAYAQRALDDCGDDGEKHRVTGWVGCGRRSSDVGARTLVPAYDAVGSREDSRIFVKRSRIPLRARPYYPGQAVVEPPLDRRPSSISCRFPRHFLSENRAR